MHKTLTMLIAFGLFLVLTGPALAQEPLRARHIRHHQIAQQGRIYQGVRSGELTRRETQRLEREQWGIRRDVRGARADGFFSPAERTEIRQDQRQASRHIYRAKHNCRDRN